MLTRTAAERFAHEWFELDAAGRVIRSAAHYAD
jgi:hypothetical protein